MPWITAPLVTEVEWNELPVTELFEAMPRLRLAGRFGRRMQWCRIRPLHAPTEDWRWTPLRFLMAAVMRLSPPAGWFGELAAPDTSKHFVLMADRLESVPPGQPFDWDAAARWGDSENLLGRAAMNDLPSPNSVLWAATALLRRQGIRENENLGQPELRDYTATIVAAVHEVVGYPWRSDLRREWITSTVIALAAGAWAERDWSRLPILADALEDAGCNRADVLGHLRGGGSHGPGCWVLSDILLPPVPAT